MKQVKYYIKNALSTILGCLIIQSTLTLASESVYPIETAPKKVDNVVALQNGAKIFVNYCLNCHSASSMRYNRLKDIGLTDDNIKDNLLFSANKVGETMKVAMNYKDAKKWFGTTPPDLSVIARSRGTDWLYTYMRSFYLDPTRPTGWNNALFHNVGMPHVLWELQGTRVAKEIEEVSAHDGKVTKKIIGFEQVTPGKLNANEYDDNIADLVSFLDWMGEPGQNSRKRAGLWILIYLSILTTVAWLLNNNYWKDIK